MIANANENNRKQRKTIGNIYLHYSLSSSVK